MSNLLCYENFKVLEHIIPLTSDNNRMVCHIVTHIGNTLHWLHIFSKYSPTTIRENLPNLPRKNSPPIIQNICWTTSAPSCNVPYSIFATIETEKSCECVCVLFGKCIGAFVHLLSLCFCKEIKEHWTYDIMQQFIIGNVALELL